MKKEKGHLITKVEPGSIAQELELQPGDRLLTINGNEVEDIFDYEYYVDSESLTMVVRRADGEEWELDIENDYEDLGREFENGLMSDYRSCCNKCIFCFIDQMPPGMRDTLYFKDDDSRLSFLQGNYITLTNMKDRDIERIIQKGGGPWKGIFISTAGTERGRRRLPQALPCAVREREERSSSSSSSRGAMPGNWSCSASSRRSLWWKGRRG